MHHSLPGAGVVKTILRSTVGSPDGGFSWVLVDAEHGLISDKDYYEVDLPFRLLIRIYMLTGIAQ